LLLVSPAAGDLDAVALHEQQKLLGLEPDGQIGCQGNRRHVEELAVVVVAAESDDRQLALLNDGADRLQVDPSDHARALVADPAFRRDDRFGQHPEGDLLRPTQFGQFIGNASAFLLDPRQGLFGNDEAVRFALQLGTETSPQFFFKAAALPEDKHHANAVSDQFADLAQDRVGDRRILDGLAFDLDYEDPAGELAVVEIGGHGAFGRRGVAGWKLPLYGNWSVTRGQALS
jgi:hypothetical protein